MRFARNKKEGKNGQKPFCPSTKTTQKRAKTVMPIRSENDVCVNISKKIDEF